MMDIVLTAVIVGGITATVVVVAVAGLVPRKSCPQCSTVLPRIRKPVSKREAMLGGWHCPNCNAKIARNGSLVSD